MSDQPSSAGRGADDGLGHPIREAYQAHYRRLVAAVYGMAGDYAEAQDIVHETFARILARPSGFLKADDQLAFLYASVFNQARSRFRRSRLFDRLVRSGRLTETATEVPGLSPDRVMLVEALRQLPRPMLEALVLYHLADRTVAQIAAQLDCPEGTVKARLARGRARLAELLTDHPSAPTALAAEELRHA